MECAQCKSPSKSTRACSSCHVVYYCSTEHQKQHWKIHKKDCPAFVIVDSSQPELGKQFIANRDLIPGAIVLDEVAACHAPIYYCKISEYLTPKAYHICIACGLELNNSTVKHCSKCKWPVCGVQCETMKIHSENECFIFSTHRITCPLPKTYGITAQLLTNFIAVLRGLGLKTRNPKLYSEIQKLQQKFPLLNLRLDQIRADEYRYQKVNACFPFLNLHPEEYYAMSRLIRVNAYLLTTPDQNPSSEYAIFSFSSRNMYLYQKASRINHSCIPNCTWIIGPAPDFKIRIRTTVNVKKGDPLTITYLTAKNILGTSERRKILEQAGFVCSCDRCLDPTELGTKLSAIVCHCSSKKANLPPEQIGYMLPFDPMCDEDDACWFCNICMFVEHHKVMLAKIEEIRAMVSEVMVTDAKTPRPPELISRIMSGYYRDLLHPNHWILLSSGLDLDNSLAPFLGAVEEFDVKDVDMVISYCKWIIEVEDKINPGLSLMRSQTLECLSKLSQLKLVFFHKSLTKLEVLEEFSHFKQYTKDALGYYQTCFPRRGEQEPHQASQLNQHLKTMEKVISKFYKAALC